MSRPDFLLVGAPKCGTTALSEYLRVHPQVFISAPKEPHFFATDLPGMRYVTTVADYERLFDAAAPDCRARGEASPAYLYSAAAIAGIRAYNPAARIVVTLRHPVELLRSYHSQLLFSLFEDERDLATAWRLQDERRAGRHIPPHCREAGLLQYRAAMALGSQLQRVYEIFPREQVLVLFHDDMRRDPGTVYRQLLAFIGVDDDGRTEFPVVNAKKAPRWGWMNVLLHNPPAWALAALRQLTGTGLHKAVVGLHGRLKTLNTRPAEHTAFPAELRAELQVAFLPEIELLEKLTGRSLDAWKTVAASR